MVTIVNSFILSDDLIKKMKDKIGETREKKIELGFGLCRIGKSNIIKPGRDCTGTECSLTEPRECRVGSYVGGYHTHPRTGTKPSITDLIIAYEEGIECIGSVIENDVKCVVRTGSTVPQVMEKISDALKNIEETLGETVTKEDLQRWEKTRDDILNTHFNVTNVK